MGCLLPHGARATLSAGQIQNATSARFEVVVALREPGSYSIQVTNPEGPQSNVFAFSVR